MVVRSYDLLARSSTPARRTGGRNSPRTRKALLSRPLLDGFEEQIVDFHTPLDGYRRRGLTM
jgi:hypothetical protein